MFSLLLRIIHGFPDGKQYFHQKYKKNQQSPTQKNNQTEGELEVCYQWKRAPVPSQKRAKWCKNYVKTITVIRIIHKPINYPKCTKRPMNWAG